LDVDLISVIVGCSLISGIVLHVYVCFYFVSVDFWSRIFGVVGGVCCFLGFGSCFYVVLFCWGLLVVCVCLLVGVFGVLLGFCLGCCLEACC